MREYRSLFRHLVLVLKVKQKNQRKIGVGAGCCWPRSQILKVSSQRSDSRALVAEPELFGMRTLASR